MTPFTHMGEWSFLFFRMTQVIYQVSQVLNLLILFLFTTIVSLICTFTNGFFIRVHLKCSPFFIHLHPVSLFAQLRTYEV